MFKTRYAYILMALLLICGSCSESPDTENTNAANEQNAQQKLLQDADGEAIQRVLASYAGDKAVLVNVWATWCAPCVEEFPDIVEIQRKYADELQVVFISADFPENRDDAVAFLKEHEVNWTTYFKTGKDEPFINALSREWSGALPFTKVVDINGNEIAHWENKADFDTFEDHVKRAINP